jgi:ATP-dependent Clp protease ATP-binding subunit ClpB
VDEILKQEFLPEFLNRIDETILFRPLGMEDLKKIVGIQLRRLEAQLAEAGLKVVITDRAKEELANEGFDPAYGARPLKRIIQQRLANGLASALLEGKTASGQTVRIDWNGSDFVFEPEQEAATA